MPAPDHLYAPRGEELQGENASGRAEERPRGLLPLALAAAGTIAVLAALWGLALAVVGR